MSDQMYRDFAISTIPEEKQVKEGDRMRTQLHTSITITERKTGKTWAKTTPYRITEIGLENIILKNFPDSTTADWLDSSRHYYEIDLVKDLSPSNVCGAMHTALRKCCDSKASAYWWNLIHNLPEGVMSKVWTAVSEALIAAKTANKTTRMCDYAKVVETAWVLAFEKLNYATREYERDRRIFGAEGYPLTKAEATKLADEFDDMSHKDFKAYRTAVFMADLAVGYLSAEDWVGMLGYLYETESVAA